MVNLKNKIYFIAEIGSNFDQSLDRAKDLIKLAKDSGADAVKFQHYTAGSLVSDHGFKSMDWSSAIKKPLLLLDATNDKLVNSSLNKELLGQSDLTTIVSLESQHEIMMEKDEIRKKAWEAIDQFLSS